MIRVPLVAAPLLLLAAACPAGPPELGRGPDRPALAPLELLDPGAAITVLVRPRDLLDSPLGSAVQPWFAPTADEAARGGPAQWFGGLGGAVEAAAAFAGEDDFEPARAVRGGDVEAQTLARRFAARAQLEHATTAEEPCADVRSFAADGTAVAAVAADLFVLGPRATVQAACRRAAGRANDSLATDPRIAPLLDALGPDPAQIVYLGRPPAALRPRLQHWGVAALGDRVVGVAVTVGAEQTTLRLAAELDDDAAAAALVASATDGIALMAARRSFAAVGLSPLIRALVPRSAGRRFFVEGVLPTAAIALALATLRTVTEAGE